MAEFNNNLVKKLPEVRGRYSENVSLGEISWFGVGGPAEVLFKPVDKDDLIGFIKTCPVEIPITVLGITSNLIIRDGGIPGVVIKLGREFNFIKKIGEYEISAGALALDGSVANFAMENSIAGFEFLSGIPGTIGGALRMNAGAYGGETKNILVLAEVLFRDGTVKNMTAEEMEMSYRHNGLPDEVFFLSAIFKGSLSSKEEIKAKIEEIKKKKEESQPIRERTGGSTFANPEGYSAWKLVDEVGMRGFKIGGAQVSEKHTNFLINAGSATAADIERLGEEIRHRVKEKFGVTLRWEIKRVGIPLEADKDILEFMKE